MLIRISTVAFVAALMTAPPPPSKYLYVWTASADSTAPDFLAVFDIEPKGDRYGRLVTTVPVPGRANMPHHTEHALADDDRLFANGFGSGQTFIFDLTNPARPKLDGQFGNVGPMMHPHSFVRLPGGNVLATYQMQHDSAGIAPGGLAEITPRGQVVRSASANGPGANRRVRPYSAAIVPELDRIVVTTTDMATEDSIGVVQIWRLSDLALLHSFDLPVGPNGEGYNTAEPRVLRDGKTVLVSTFNCGLFRLDGIATAAPRGRMVASFARKSGTNCAIPVVAGRFYLVTVPSGNAVVSLDVSDPDRPREVSRVRLGASDVPHWISLEPNTERVVITGYQGMENRVVMARFDSATGALSIDQRFRAVGSAEPGFRLGPAVPHGAVFSRPPVVAARAGGGGAGPSLALHPADDPRR